MNQDINPLELIARDLSQSTSPAILLAQNPSADSVWSAFALYFGLSRLGKAPVILSSSKVTLPIKDIDLIRTSMGTSGENLVISFPYTDGSIDKVDYRIENNVFNLIIIPRPGFPKVTKEQISYSYGGGKADCLIALDAPSIESIGRIYTENQETFDTLPLINIDRHSNNMQYGSVNYVIPAVSSVSQLVFDILRGVQIAIDAAMATQILNGIVASTNNFTGTNTNAEVFADVAELMKLGAVREQAQSAQQMQPPRSQGRAPQTTQANTAQPMSGQSPPNQQQNVSGQSQPQPRGQRQSPQTANAPANTQPLPNQRQQSRPGNAPRPQTAQPVQNNSWVDAIPQDQTQNDAAPADQKANGNADEAPQDWLKPKIFKGNGFV